MLLAREAATFDEVRTPDLWVHGDKESTKVLDTTFVVINYSDIRPLVWFYPCRYGVKITEESV